MVHRAGVEPANNALIGRARPPLPPPLRSTPGGSRWRSLPQAYPQQLDPRSSASAVPPREQGFARQIRLSKLFEKWSGWLDSNQRLLVPKTSRLTTDLHPEVGTPGRSRTCTDWFLRPVPLPIGLQEQALPAGVEPTTSGFVDRRSIPLSYGSQYSQWELNPHIDCF